MQITTFLHKENICLGLEPREKTVLLTEMTQNLAQNGIVRDQPACLAAVLEREAQFSTGVGGGIGIPHCKNDSVAQMGIGAATIPEGMEYNALDGQPVRLVFMLAGPSNASNEHVMVLARLSQLLLLPGVVDALVQAQDTDAFLQIVTQGEATLLEQEKLQARRKAARAAAEGRYTVLAVTGCPTGIAHTYMAAQALEQAAEEIGIALKVETNGAAGVNGKLTTEEIAACKGILVAADRAVEMDRFAGKPVLRVPVAKAISQPETLLRSAAKGDAPLYQVENTHSVEAEVPAKEKFWQAGYRHWMNGMGKIIPLLMGAGALGVLASVLPSAAGAAIFQIGLAAQAVVLVLLSGYIAKSIAGEPGLAVGCVAGVLVEMGVSLLGTCQPGFVGSIMAGFLSGGVVLFLQRLAKQIPEEFAGLKPMLIYPVVGMIITGLAMLVLNIPATFLFAFIYNGLQAMPVWLAVLLGAALGSMIVIDLGGPINKLAYGFAVLMLTAQQTRWMAVVMVAGMIPPLATGFAALMRKNCFSQREQGSAASCIALGMGFVSEAALPLSQRVPRATRPAFVCGAALAGGLSIVWDCGSPVPHGGIFALPLMHHPFAWLAALVWGTVLSTGLLLLLLKPVNKEK